MKSAEGCWRSETSRREPKRVRWAKECIITMTDLQLPVLETQRASQWSLFLSEILPHPQQNTDDWLFLTLNRHYFPFLCLVCNKMTKYPPIHPFLCMDMTYITCLLKDGFGFKESTVLQVRQHCIVKYKVVGGLGYTGVKEVVDSIEEFIKGLCNIIKSAIHVSSHLVQACRWIIRWKRIKRQCFKDEKV